VGLTFVDRVLVRFSVVACASVTAVKVIPNNPSAASAQAVLRNILISSEQEWLNSPADGHRALPRLIGGELGLSPSHGQRATYSRMTR
jgi:hypothetical protein